MNLTKVFVSCTTWSPKLQTQCLCDDPPEKTWSVASLRKAYKVSSVHVFGEDCSLLFSRIIAQVLQFLLSLCLMKGRNSGCFLRMGVWTTLQLINTRAERRCKFGGGDKCEFIVIRWKRA